MAKIVNMHEARSSLSSLIEQAESGEEIIIALAGKPVARLVAIRRGERRLGQWKGKVRMSNDFNAPLAADDLVSWEHGD
jgi:prevent-host-death family protein